MANATCSSSVKKPIASRHAPSKNSREFVDMCFKEFRHKQRGLIDFYIQYKFYMSGKPEKVLGSVEKYYRKNKHSIVCRMKINCFSQAKMQSYETEQQAQSELYAH